MLAAAVTSALAFSAGPMPSNAVSARGSAVVMTEQPMLARRAMLGAAAAAITAAPMAAFADGASSPAVLARSRAIYGSRVFRLQDASPESILADKNAFTLFTTGAYPRTGNAAFKETQAGLKAASKKALAAAAKGDKAGAQAAVKEFCAIGQISNAKDYDNFDPKQRRNPGAPPTSELEELMGSQSFALYDPLKPAGKK
jgi:hypothetical protein